MNLKKRNKIPEINITPLVDVMLVLLVIFMTVAPSLHDNIKAKLPIMQHSKNQCKPENNFVKITILKNKIFIDDKEIERNNFFNEINKIKKDVAVIVEVDQNLSYGEAFEIFDLIKKAQFPELLLTGISEN